jgi:hypothetical protein
MPGFALSLFFVFGSNAQSPTDGKVAGNQYVNSYFHISYAWPKILQPYDTGSLQLPSQSPYSNEFLLFSARQGGQPYGVVILAERLKLPDPSFEGNQRRR